MPGDLSESCCCLRCLWRFLGRVLALGGPRAPWTPLTNTPKLARGDLVGPLPEASFPVWTEAKVRSREERAGLGGTWLWGLGAGPAVPHVPVQLGGASWSTSCSCASLRLSVPPSCRPPPLGTPRPRALMPRPPPQVGSFFMINLCLVVIATQFSETKQREHRLMLEQRRRYLSSSTVASYAEPGDCYEELFQYACHILRKAKRRALGLYQALQRRRQAPGPGSAAAKPSPAAREPRHYSEWPSGSPDASSQDPRGCWWLVPPALLEPSSLDVCPPAGSAPASPLKADQCWPSGEHTVSPDTGSCWDYGRGLGTPVPVWPVSPPWGPLQSRLWYFLHRGEHGGGCGPVLVPDLVLAQRYGVSMSWFWFWFWSSPVGHTVLEDGGCRMGGSGSGPVGCIAE